MNANVDQVAEERLKRAAAAADAAPPWTEKLQRAGKNGYLGNEYNALVALTEAPDLAGLVAFNEFALRVEFTRSPPWRRADVGTAWSDADDTQAQVWMQINGIAVSRPGVVASTVLVAARRRAFHPVQGYVNGLIWDGTPRLRTMFITYFGASSQPEYLAAIGLRFMASAVARIMRPGCQADHVLVLEGPQGIGKTSAARTLACRPEWFAGSLPDIGGKDAQLQLAGRWIIEISELKAVRNSQVEAVKSYLTQTVDTFRPPYGRRSEQHPRQCVFIATTNEDTYLRDRTGNRRFLPVRATRIDLAALARDRDQLWAEATHEYRAGTQWHPTPEETALATLEQTERVEETEVEQEVRVYLAELLARVVTETSVADVLSNALNIRPDSETYAERARRAGPEVAGAMRAAGWRKVDRRGGGDNKRTIYRWGGQGGQG